MKSIIPYAIVAGVVMLILFLGDLLHKQLKDAEHADKKAFKFLELLLFSKCPVCGKHGIRGLKFTGGTISKVKCIHCRTELIVHNMSIMIAVIIAIPLALGINALMTVFTDNKSLIAGIQVTVLMLCYYPCSYFAHVETPEDYYGHSYKKPDDNNGKE